MKKTVLKIVSAIAVLSLVLFTPAASALAETVSAADTAFDVPCFFSSGMVFQQKKNMNIWGTATPGREITATLKIGMSTLDTAVATADTDGKWSLSFSPRSGGFQEYSVEIAENGSVLCSFDDVLIGEVWIGSGQSNMMFTLVRQIGSTEIMNNAAENESYSYVRVLDCTNASGTESVRGVQFDTRNSGGRLSSWGYGNEILNIRSLSAYGMLVSYKLFDTLNVPVGFIDASIGSTPIEAWLSKDAINSDSDIVAALEKYGAYRSGSSSEFNQMCGSWYTRLGPLAGMNVSGFIWYQGCSNMEVGLVSDEGFYENALDAFIIDLAEKFGFENADSMPFIVSQLAADYYMSGSAGASGKIENPQCNVSLPKWCEEVKAVVDKYSLAQQITFYDADLVYRLEGMTDENPGNGPDHPSDKRTLANRTADAILSNVYKADGTAPDYYIPEVESWVINDDGHVIVTFKNTSKGLGVIGGGKEPEGFAICGKDKVFSSANAKIISENQVEIWNSLINDTVGFTYGFTNFNMNADLCNSYGLPALQFRSLETDDANYANPNDSLSCDHLTFWDNSRHAAKFSPCWSTGSLSGLTSSDATELEISTDTLACGQGSVKFSYTANGRQCFSAGPDFNAYTGMTSAKLQNYNTLTVLVSNPDAREKTLRLYGLAADGRIIQIGSKDGYILPAGSAFECYAFDLNQLAGTNGKAVSKSLLSSLTNLEFVIGDGQDGSVYFDCIELGSQGADEAFMRIAAEKAVSGIPAKLDELNMDSFVKAFDTASKAVKDYKAQYPNGVIQNYGAYENARLMIYSGNGDVNSDGNTDSQDALLILQHCVGKAALTNEQQKFADVNSDGSVDSKDALLVLQTAVGKR